MLVRERGGTKKVSHRSHSSFVDAENAFNNLNRNVAIENVKHLCPPFHRYLLNTYQKPAKLIISGNNTHEIIMSDEGCTQGDVNAMGFYGVGIAPLISTLADSVDTTKCKQSWYADDSSAAGKLIQMKIWWDTLSESGPKYGYYPLASKTVLIVKEQFLSEARDIFGDSGVTITTEGERHMGAVIGSPEFKQTYVRNKISKWIQDVETLAEIAKDEPQAAYASFTKAISRRWTYIQRTIPGISDLFQPLEQAIRDKLMPAIIGRAISDIERKIFSLPVRLGGLGIQDPTVTADLEYRASIFVTRDLTDIIYNQERDFSNFDDERVKNAKKYVKSTKDAHHDEILKEILETVNSKMKRTLKLSQEKGAGLWLTANPSESYGFTLNKQDFRDSICLRYDWRVPNTSSYCQCGQKNRGPCPFMQERRIRHYATQ